MHKDDASDKASRSLEIEAGVNVEVEVDIGG